MSRYEHGRILAVNESTLGSELVGDHAQGVGSLTVEDPVDFDEDGGWLSINGQVAEYTTYDDDTGEITLAGTLDAAASEGDRVDLWDELRQVVTVDKIAQVELDGDDDNTDPLEAIIPLHLLDDLAEGIRGTRGESVLLEQDGDEWRIVDVLGLASQGASGTQFEDRDTFTIGAPGAQTFQLTHQPIDGSLHMIWNGLDQPRSESTVSGRTVTVPDPDGYLLVGDVLDFKYAYLVDGARALSVDYGAAGWKYLAIDSSDAVDRSAPSFDDSTWAQAASPFGNPIPLPDGTTAAGYGWPDPVTPWTLETALWVRRAFDRVPAGAPVTVQVRVDNEADIYWNGTFVANSGELTETAEISVPSALVTSGTNVLAIRANDLGGVSYLDVRAVVNA